MKLPHIIFLMADQLRYDHAVNRELMPNLNSLL
mgnify:CR=1 FL=1